MLFTALAMEPYFYCLLCIVILTKRCLLFQDNPESVMHLVRLRPRHVVNLPGAQFADFDITTLDHILRWLRVQRVNKGMGEIVA